VNTLAYPVVIQEVADADFVASFPDIPEAITGAQTRERALMMAEDALATAIEHYLEIGRPCRCREPATDCRSRRSIRESRRACCSREPWTSKGCDQGCPGGAHAGG